MKKFDQIKVKHHYVWEYYLRSWSVDNKLFWLTSKGKIALDSPKGMCRENGFYKISIFDEADLNYIGLWSKNSPEFLQKQHVKQIEPFIQISNIIKLYRASGIADEEVIRHEETLLYNSLENLYAGIELGAKPAIDALKKGNISALNDIRVCIGLYSYLGHQLTRTKSVKDRFFEQSLIKVPPSKNNDEAYRLAEKNWWFLCYMLGENVGFSLYETRNENKIFLVKNMSNIPYITCDSPVINIHPDNDELPRGEAPKSMDLMFPISPDYVLIIATSSKWDYLKHGADKKGVIELNLRIASKARSSIYGNSRAVIESNRAKVGKW